MATTTQFANATAEAKQLRKAAGSWLREMRKAAGLSQAQLAENLGLKHYTFISQNGPRLRLGRGGDGARRLAGLCARNQVGRRLRHRGRRMGLPS
jgi:transcriptional regulator with XRE-family HTH domain